ncbi:MAG: acylphosphatase [Phaeodactylibacter sp.]|nr:acylphosphatase [Phaeodactylibacter sp.]MCB9264542.1 acylphosphatase [Lewinellaceae bacterium]
MKRYKLRIKGKVQGVWYRASARRKAEELSLSGFVRNEADGSVYAEAEGDEEALQAFVRWCKQGPEMARVEKVDVEEAPLRGSELFEVQR